MDPGQLLSCSTLATEKFCSFLLKGPCIRLLIFIFGASQLSFQKLTGVPSRLAILIQFGKSSIHKIEVHLVGGPGEVMYLAIKNDAQGVWG